MMNFIYFGANLYSKGFKSIQIKFKFNDQNNPEVSQNYDAKKKNTGKLEKDSISLYVIPEAISVRGAGQNRNLSHLCVLFCAGSHPSLSAPPQMFTFHYFC